MSARTRNALVAFALTLPEAWEDFPWGERVVKVRKKIFLFAGSDEGDGFAVKLLESHGHAMSLPTAAPSGYGLGKSGWVSVGYGKGLPPLSVLKDWVEESYRLVAP